MEKYKVQAVFIVVALFVLILLIHTAQNLKERSTPSSEKWSHAEEIGTTSSVKPPFLEVNDQGDPVFSYIANDKLEVVTMKEDFSIAANGVNLNGKSVTDFVKYRNNLLFISGGTLFGGTIAGSSLEDVKQVSDQSILDLSITEQSGQAFAAATTTQGVLLYELSDRGLKELTSLSMAATEDFPNKRLVGLKMNDSLLSLVIVSQTSKDTLQYHYAVYDTVSGKVNEKLIATKELDALTPYTFTDVDFEMNDQNQLEVLTTYQFFKKGSFKRVEHFSYDVNSDTMIVPAHLLDVPYARDTLSSVAIIGKNDEGGLSITLNMEAKTGREKATFRMVEMQLNNGEVGTIDYISSPYVYTRSSSLIQTEKGSYLAWLEKEADKQFNVMVSGTSKAYYSHMDRINGDMVANALYSVINSFVSSFIWIIVTGLWAVPALVVIPLLEWFKSSIWVEEKINRVMILTLIITLATEYFFFGDLFYAPGKTIWMPGWLHFPGAEYLIPILIAVLSFIPMLIFKKSMEIPHALGLYTFFMTSNVLLLDLLYAPYLI